MTEVTVGIPTFNRAELVGGAIASVLAQTYRHFRLIVSDNASDDGTPAVVASFDDPRLVYRRHTRNLGRHANINSVIHAAETEFVLILGDDDELHPDHLTRAMAAAASTPRVGAIHTGYTMIDSRGNTVAPHVSLKRDGVLIESGARFLRRNMTSGPDVHISSTVFRKAALVGAGGLRPEDGVIDDFPLLMRIATRWDFAYVNAPLVTVRAHEGASSSTLGSFTPRGFRSSRALPEILHEHRLKFLAEADLPAAQSRSLARIAERSHRRDVLSHLSMRAVTGDGTAVAFWELRKEIRRNPRLAGDPLTWRFVAAQLGGRRARDVARGALGRA